MSSEIIAKSQSDMEHAAEKFLAKLEANTPAIGATLVGLSGDLGAGKTTFTQAVAKALGISETVTSPTFVIEKIYVIPESAKSRFHHLVHIDAYRLESPDELARLGFSEISADPENLILIEWPERLEGLLPSDIRRLSFTHLNETARSILIY